MDFNNFSADIRTKIFQALNDKVSPGKIDLSEMKAMGLSPQQEIELMTLLAGNPGMIGDGFVKKVTEKGSTVLFQEKPRQGAVEISQDDINKYQIRYPGARIKDGFLRNGVLFFRDENGSLIRDNNQNFISERLYFEEERPSFINPDGSVDTDKFREYLNSLPPATEDYQTLMRDIEELSEEHAKFSVSRSLRVHKERAKEFFNAINNNDYSKAGELLYSYFEADCKDIDKNFLSKVKEGLTIITGAKWAGPALYGVLSDLSDDNDENHITAGERILATVDNAGEGLGDFIFSTQGLITMATIAGGEALITKASSTLAPYIGSAIHSYFGAEGTMLVAEGAYQAATAETMEGIAEGGQMIGHGLPMMGTVVGAGKALIKGGKELYTQNTNIREHQQKISEAKKTLGLTENSPINESTLKTAYKKAMLKAHPDRGGSIEAKAELDGAYELLKNELKQAEEPGAKEFAETKTDSETPQNAETTNPVAELPAGIETPVTDGTPSNIVPLYQKKAYSAPDIVQTEIAPSQMIASSAADVQTAIAEKLSNCRSTQDIEALIRNAKTPEECEYIESQLEGKSINRAAIEDLRDYARFQAQHLRMKDVAPSDIAPVTIYSMQAALGDGYVRTELEGNFFSKMMDKISGNEAAMFTSQDGRYKVGVLYSKKTGKVTNLRIIDTVENTATPVSIAQTATIGKLAESLPEIFTQVTKTKDFSTMPTDLLVDEYDTQTNYNLSDLPKIEAELTERGIKFTHGKQIGGIENIEYTERTGSGGITPVSSLAEMEDHIKADVQIEQKFNNCQSIDDVELMVAEAKTSAECDYIASQLESSNKFGVSETRLNQAVELAKWRADRLRVDEQGVKAQAPEQVAIDPNADPEGFLKGAIKDCGEPKKETIDLFKNKTRETYTDANGNQIAIVERGKNGAIEFMQVAHYESPTSRPTITTIGKQGPLSFTSISRASAKEVQEFAKYLEEKYPGFEDIPRLVKSFRQYPDGTKALETLEETIGRSLYSDEIIMLAKCYEENPEACMRLLSIKGDDFRLSPETVRKCVETEAKFPGTIEQIINDPVFENLDINPNYNVAHGNILNFIAEGYNSNPQLVRDTYTTVRKAYGSDYTFTELAKASVSDPKGVQTFINDPEFANFKFVSRTGHHQWELNTAIDAYKKAPEFFRQHAQNYCVEEMPDLVRANEINSGLTEKLMNDQKNFSPKEILDIVESSKPTDQTTAIGANGNISENVDYAKNAIKKYLELKDRGKDAEAKAILKEAVNVVGTEFLEEASIDAGANLYAQANGRIAREMINDVLVAIGKMEEPTAPAGISPTEARAKIAELQNQLKQYGAGLDRYDQIHMDRIQSEIKALREIAPLDKTNLQEVLQASPSEILEFKEADNVKGLGISLKQNMPDDPALADKWTFTVKPAFTNARTIQEMITIAERDGFSIELVPNEKGELYPKIKKIWDNGEYFDMSPECSIIEYGEISADDPYIDQEWAQQHKYKNAKGDWVVMDRAVIQNSRKHAASEILPKTYIHKGGTRITDNDKTHWGGYEAHKDPEGRVNVVAYRTEQTLNTPEGPINTSVTMGDAEGNVYNNYKQLAKQIRPDKTGYRKLVADPNDPNSSKFVDLVLAGKDDEAIAFLQDITEQTIQARDAQNTTDPTHPSEPNNGQSAESATLNVGSAEQFDSQSVENLVNSGSAQIQEDGTLVIDPIKLNEATEADTKASIATQLANAGKNLSDVIGYDFAKVITDTEASINTENIQELPGGSSLTKCRNASGQVAKMISKYPNGSTETDYVLGKGKNITIYADSNGNTYAYGIDLYGAKPVVADGNGNVITMAEFNRIHNKVANTGVAKENTTSETAQTPKAPYEAPRIKDMAESPIAVDPNDPSQHIARSSEYSIKIDLGDNNQLYSTTGVKGLWNKYVNESKYEYSQAVQEISQKLAQTGITEIVRDNEGKIKIKVKMSPQESELLKDKPAEDVSKWYHRGSKDEREDSAYEFQGIDEDGNAVFELIDLGFGSSKSKNLLEHIHYIATSTTNTYQSFNSYLHNAVKDAKHTREQNELTFEENGMKVINYEPADSNIEAQYEDPASLTFIFNGRTYVAIFNSMEQISQTNLETLLANIVSGKVSDTLKYRDLKSGGDYVQNPVLLSKKQHNIDNIAKNIDKDAVLRQHNVHIYDYEPAELNMNLRDNYPASILFKFNGKTYAAKLNELAPMTRADLELRLAAILSGQLEECFTYLCIDESGAKCPNPIIHQ